MQNVAFDPGYSSCLLGVSDSLEFAYSAFVSSMIPAKQKKFQFQMLYPKLKNMLTSNISFYLGCLLWAVYLKSVKDGVIEDNPCLNTDYDEESSLEEVNFLIDFVNEKFARDVKYYLNQNFEKDERYIKILEQYASFIKLNRGFVDTKATSDIVLPDGIKTPDEKAILTIKNKIEDAIDKKELSLLYDVYDLILD